MNLWRLDGVTRRDVEEPPGSAPPSLISQSVAPSGHNAQPWSARLSDGELWDMDVECPQHGSRFNLITGKVTGLPAVIPATTYPVTLEGDEVFVEVAE